jgi:glutathione S-transferase
MPITVYGMAVSGNCWKARQILELTGHEVIWVETDGNSGATRTEKFLALNPNGKVPTVVLPDGTVLVESNAILAHFAEGTAWMPPPGLARTRVLEWLFFEQYSHEPYVAVARFIAKFLPADHPRRADLPRLREKSRDALGVMEMALSKRPYLASTGFGIADIALFAYTHDAPAAGIALDEFPNVTQWLARVRAQPGFVAQ